MSNDKFKFTKEKLKEMEGFEEIMDLLKGEKGAGPHISTKIKSGVHDLYHFLEVEKERLERLNHLFTTQIQNFENNSHTFLLVEKQDKELEKTKHELLMTISPKTSLLNKNLSSLFDNAFKKYSE